MTGAGHRVISHLDGDSALTQSPPATVIDAGPGRPRLVSSTSTTIAGHRGHAAETFRWIAFYNHRRRWAIGYLSPAHYEQRL
ncbi:MAG: hypothetical protein JWP76_3861 [Dactylosporangium sp.]|nr:hypothetical protein [Dactylosporangium sp.]